jgi:hypothetical protein
MFIFSLYVAANLHLRIVHLIDWNPVTKEDALKGSDMDTYSASKTLAEQALWEFAAQHKDLDITTCKFPRSCP